MRKKKITALLAVMLCLAMILTACGTAKKTDDTARTGAAETADTARTDTTVTPEAPEAIADGDTRDVTGQSADAEIVLSGGEGTLSDTTRGSSGSTVTITAKGVYHVTGSSDGVQILIQDDSESGNVYLILDNVSMTNDGACINVQAADKVILQCVGDSTLTTTASADADGVDGAVYARDDLTVNGEGSLTVTSGMHGIVCKDDLTVTGSALTVNAAAIGIQAGDSVTVADGAVTVTAGHDGIQVKNDEGDSFVYLAGGTLTVDAGYDGIDVGTEGATFTGYILMEGGEANITAGGGSDNAKDSGTSQKGIKCDGAVTVTGGTLTVSAADDAIHSDGAVTVTGGVITASSSDDGIHAYDTLTITGGTVTVTKAYEGLEAATVDIQGGEISVTASDDGINAAGGSDSASDESPWGGSAGGTLTVSGGSLYVNAGGDGLDSNGSIYITGGLTVVEGPTNGGNGALDKGDGADCVLSVTGGTVLALGTADMAVNFDDGTQCAGLVALSGSAGDTVTVDDGSGFTFTATKSFACAVYTSPSLSQGSTYTITAGADSAVMDFAAGLYYADVTSMGGGPGMR